VDEPKTGLIASRLQTDEGTQISYTLQPLQEPSHVSSKQTLGAAPDSKPQHERVGDGTKGSHAFAPTSLGENERLRTTAFPHLQHVPEFKLNERWQPVKLVIAGQGEKSAHDDGASPIAVKTLAGHEIAPPGRLYLFNLIVALEWQPSNRTLDTLMRAFRAASDTLYDATNGGMAFGQVVFAGPEHLGKADIQILASNRFHPRSSVDGLSLTEKYSPIRLGRGIWRKERRVLVPWDDTVGFRAIAHEWAHYALGLHDEYIDEPVAVTKSRGGLRLVKAETEKQEFVVVPRELVALQTLMETLDADELVPHMRQLSRADDQKKAERLCARIKGEIESKFEGVAERLCNDNPGPHTFPLPLPRFFLMPGGSIQPRPTDSTLYYGDEGICDVERLVLDHCWLYSYRWEDGKLLMMAQGSVGREAKAKRPSATGPKIEGEGFELLGVREQDRILAIGLESGDAEAVHPTKTQSGEIAEFFLKQAGQDEGASQVAPPKPDSRWVKFGGNGWSDPVESEPPVIAVIPAPITAQEVKQAKALGTLPPMRVSVRLTGGGAYDMVWLASPGEEAQQLAAAPATLATTAGATMVAPQPIAHMDGIVALESDDAISWVAEFSYGGNGPTTVRSPGAPISAGSSDGNLMIFSSLGEDLANAQLNEKLPNYDKTRADFYNKPIVTTRNYAGFEKAGFADELWQIKGKPVSYLFAVAAAEPVDLQQRPTIVMYFDAGALREGELLVIHRYDGERWAPLPTYLPQGVFYAATPISAETAPSLVHSDVPDGARVEYYRLFSITAS